MQKLDPRKYSDFTVVLCILIYFDASFKSSQRYSIVKCFYCVFECLCFLSVLACTQNISGLRYFQVYRCVLLHECIERRRTENEMKSFAFLLFYNKKVVIVDCRFIFSNVLMTVNVRSVDRGFILFLRTEQIEETVWWTSWARDTLMAISIGMFIFMSAPDDYWPYSLLVYSHMFLFIYRHD